MEIPHDLINRLFHAVKFAGKEIENAKFFTFVDSLELWILVEIYLFVPFGHDHVIEALMRETGNCRIAAKKLEVLEHGAIPL